jgi:hypothetical protein
VIFAAAPAKTGLKSSFAIRTNWLSDQHGALSCFCRLRLFIPPLVMTLIVGIR